MIPLENVTILKSDYADYGGQVIRWGDSGESYPDCSCGCKWFTRTDDSYGVCKKPDGPREGLLTFEHQAGYFCFDPV